MSRIKELIKEKCPNGVKYSKLNELVDYIQPTKYLVKDTNYNDNYDIPVLTAGQTFILGYTREKDSIFKASKERPVIIFDDFTTSNHWVDFDFKVKSSAIKILISKSNDNFRYIYHCINNIKYLPKEHSRQWIQNFSEFKIPIPPIEIQEEIARILDKFEELEAELEVRKQQYEFWRRKLFNNDRECLRLGDLCSIKTGSKPIEILEIGKYEYINAGTSNSGYVDEINSKGDCVTTPSRGQGGIGYVGFQNNDFWCGPLCYQIRSLTDKLLNRYLYYYMLTNSDYILGLKHEGGVPAVNVKELQEMPILLPSLEEQNRIVGILDRFDKLINDISVGLPAEIELRRKQYEYYRNKLLNFEEYANE